MTSDKNNVYDAALRAVGVRVTEVATVADLEAAIGPRTALVYILLFVVIVLTNLYLYFVNRRNQEA